MFMSSDFDMSTVTSLVFGSGEQAKSSVVANMVRDSLIDFFMTVLPFLDGDNLPDQDYITSHGEEDGFTHDGRLLYVAVTRAKTSLILLYTGELTSLLPVDESLYHRVKP